MSNLYDLDAPKKATNLSINSDLLRKARSCGINLSKHFEESLERLIAQEERRRWLEENAEAFEAQNRRIEKFGAFSEKLRRF